MSSLFIHIFISAIRRSARSPHGKCAACAGHTLCSHYGGSRTMNAHGDGGRRIHNALYNLPTENIALHDSSITSKPVNLKCKTSQQCSTARPFVMSDSQTPALEPNETQQESVQQYQLNPENARNSINDCDYDNTNYSSVENKLATIFHIDSSTIFTSSNFTTPPLEDIQQSLESIHNQDQATQSQQAQTQSPLPQDGPGAPPTANLPTIPGPTGPIADLLYSSRAQAIQAFRQRQVPHDWQPTRNDLTVPQTQADRNRYVSQLKAAIVDISQCNDTITTPSFQKRWANVAWGASTYDFQEMDIACKKLLEITENIHRHGPRSLVRFNRFLCADCSNLPALQSLLFFLNCWS
jgi:hypothetical protein